ncbi:fimbrillin family protein [Elizabethkingia meningoseptica]|uniref:fimbrillin family protein n=1 Tax=Elizabethkingia meningoseptica TaxID=238 RepID=UPI0023AF4714|nr:fimbrillin family protein [Elizabethkingia meningoseptica]MDE5436997.1 fimbrillin family protein [Elizabethkingia meningoseptica]MDE5508976.1 fimbrillin family protein [Elizabethkingia meningoseptica]MDE5514493.1 fimbrillin family protein [Elizabethkingia meningoseptica]MDE5525139.1 fimbrillin family protein [Elizabethkingia meningoseptica]MDE5528704.1 fimbrillin family protein [Elizabethkingia meningoseptica]
MNNKKLTIAGLILSVSFLVASCRSTDGAVDNGGGTPSTGSAVVKVNLLESDYEIDTDTSSPMASVKQAGAVSSEKEQVKTFLNEDKLVVATLTPVVPSVKIQTQAGINPMAAAGPVQGNLKNGVVFRMYVYRGNTYITDKVYTIDANGKSVPTGGDMLLNGDNESVNKYTFILYSYNSTVTPPAITGNLDSNPSVGSITGDSDLLYARIDNVRVSSGDNVLSAVLKHMFSQITTTVDVTSVNGGQGIRSINGAANNATMTRHRISGSALNVANGAITYGTAGTRTIDFSGNSITSPVWVSKPALIVNPGTGGTEAPVLTMNNIIVGTTNPKTKSQTIDGIVVRPGVKYDLKLTFKCTQIATPTYEFDMLQDPAVDPSIEKTFNFPAADAGFTFNVYELDNSLNLSINGTEVSSQEIQFQSAVTGIPQNIRFKSDRTLWGTSGNSEIYNIHGYNATTPSASTTIVRITIAPDGSVSMLGRRNIGTALEPIELYDPATGTGSTNTAIAASALVKPFNRVVWNSAATNVVKATMKVTGRTQLKGYGEGRKIVTPCP